VPAAATGGSKIVGGGDALAPRTAQELCALQGRRIVVPWRQNPDFARVVEAFRWRHPAKASTRSPAAAPFLLDDKTRI
jgi:hypothetical protein